MTDAAPSPLDRLTDAVIAASWSHSITLEDAIALALDLTDDEATVLLAKRTGAHIPRHLMGERFMLCKRGHLRRADTHDAPIFHFTPQGRAVADVLPVKRGNA